MCKQNLFFNLSDGEYVNAYRNIKKQENNSINDVINRAFNINIESMSLEEVEELLKTRAVNAHETLYTNCLLSLDAINKHLELLAAAINEQGGAKEVVLNNKTIYNDIAVIANRLSDIICTLLISFPHKYKFFTLNDYNEYALPVINNLLFIVRQIEFNVKNNEKFPLNFYTTNSYFGIENLIIKIEYKKDSIDLKAVSKSVKNLWSTLLTSRAEIEKQVTGISETYLETSNLKKIIAKSTPARIFADEMINGGVLNEVIEHGSKIISANIGSAAASAKAAVVVATSTNAIKTTKAATEMADAAVKASTIAAKESVNILSKITGTAAKASTKAATLTVKSKNALLIARASQAINVVSLGLTAADVVLAGVNTYKRTKENYVINDLYGIEEDYINMPCTKVYRKIERH